MTTIECPLIKAALGDAAVLFGPQEIAVVPCPLIKAALGDAARWNLRSCGDRTGVH